MELTTRDNKVKIAKKQLKRIIKEEIEKVLKEHDEAEQGSEYQDDAEDSDAWKPGDYLEITQAPGGGKSIEKIPLEEYREEAYKGQMKALVQIIKADDKRSLGW